ncbi:DUF2281 domain-containing protein [Nostoc spongiaeforme FACHB-130]|uniref:DUF2281 domain-containing protein n=1 Tax=Nostoc spongiaeforme FACHB-130 TaxID=1357510 RepID=A0ABR8G519_9NOSO|nr:MULTISPECIES: DUF2281 domain-containing protein [Nostoc]MBD2300336.1 DUF2281 domain-containing protein [Nostoc sp. FACHB-190]MBD2598246.1 DUF2281 domain-containing protein [Nostoc spongiaeforme FACHB-130]
MSDTIDIEQAILESLRSLSHDKQQEVLDFVEFLVQKTANQKHLVNEAVSKPQKRLSLQEIARLPIAERHKILEPFIAATAEDFLTDTELTEFSVLDGEDWEIEDD